ncbi:MAG: type II secretion system protein [Bacillota bacterium]|nr:type II secretion system protein [Bacillota bacterium]
MWKSSNKKGITLIEVICSLAVFTIIVSFSTTLFLSTLKTKAYIKEINISKQVLEGVKRELLFNCKRSELKQAFDSGRVYIACTSTVYEHIQLDKVTDLFTSDIPSAQPYIELFDDEQDTTSHVILRLHISYYGRNKLINCEFYKGEL